MAHHQIDYIEFPATDINETRDFYTKVFSWKFTDYGPGYTSFEDGRLSGGFDINSKASGNAPLIVIYSENLEETKQTLIDAGGEIIKDIYEFPGGKRFHFKDPNGNELAVWSE